MKLITKILKILFGLALFIFGVFGMFIAPSFMPAYFSVDNVGVTKVIMFYLFMNGICNVVWAVANESPVRDFRIEITEAGGINN